LGIVSLRVFASDSGEVEASIAEALTVLPLPIFRKAPRALLSKK
jgi:hypothetical protein